MLDEVETETSDGDRAWWAQDADTVLTELGSEAEGGLTAAAARATLSTTGPNELSEVRRRSLLLMLLSQFANTMIVVLVIAAGITVVVGDATDAIVIGAIVVLNGVIGFVQEFRAERAMAALRTLAAPSARVARDGETLVVPARDVVPGDLLLLQSGDVVAADARLLAAPNLRVNEAALTGESVPVDKITDRLPAATGRLLAERRNMVFKGTSVVYGRGRAVVTATGMSTALGNIAGLLQSHQAPATPLQRRLAVLGRRLAAASVVVCGIVFVAGIARGEEASLMFLTAVSLAVAAIPEALPAVVTIALALGAQRMSRRNALVRKLPAVETLGSVTVICTDKTGTLTEGRMLVERVWTADGEILVTGAGYEPAGELRTGAGPAEPGPDTALGDALLVAALCNDAALIPPGEAGGTWDVTGDPTEGALLALAAKAGLSQAARTRPRVAEIPFDSTRKRMTTVHRDGEGVLVATKGAVEAVLARSAQISAAAGVRPLPTAEATEITARAEAYADAGYRVLALAGARRRDDAGEAERDLVFYGLAAMADPPRAASTSAVAACRAAGITPVMITGDHPATGRAIAERIGLLERGLVLTGAQADAVASGDVDVADVAVYARTSPEQKLDIVGAWKRRGDIVAMTGDGVNDAPALRSADIGVAMGITGTEVAKEAADMVLTDDDFATIVAAVREGRRIYDNIRRFVRYTLTSNSGEIWVMLLGPFLGLPLPLLPVHILWINLVTDGLPGLALGVERAERGVMERPPRPPTESVFSRGLWQHVLVVGLLMGLVPLGLGVWGEATGRPWQTMIFTSLALLQLGHALAVRSERESLWSLGATSNRSLLLAVAGTLLLQLGAIYWSAGRNLLDIEMLSLFELGVVLGASTIVFWAVELEKAIRRLRG